MAGAGLKRINLFLSLFVVFAALFTQPGCWDQREVERLGLVLATGVDMAPGGRIKVILQNINPSAMARGVVGAGGGGGGAGAGKPYSNRSTESETIFEGIRDLSRQTPRQLFFAHNQVILVTERLARERGLEEVLDFFERNPQVRRTTWFLIAKGDLETLLDEPEPLEQIPAQRIFDIINEQHLTSRYAARRLEDFLEMMESDGTHPYTAMIERIKNPAAPPEHRNRLAEGHLAEPHQTIKINGTAIFRRDRMAGQLNPGESRGLLWVKGEVRGGTMEIPNPGQKDRTVTLEILRTKTKLEPALRDGRIYMKVAVKVDSNLAETTGPLDLSKPETINKLEKLQNGAVQKEIESVLAKAQQEYGVDIFGFGQAVHRKYPRQWKEMKGRWSGLFPGVEVQILVDSKIRRTGMITKPVEPKQR